MAYRERLGVPPSWWILAGLLAASVLLAVGWYLGLRWGLGVGLGTMAVLAAIFVSTSVTITVEAGVLQVGRAWIEARYLANATALDRTATERRGGPSADARAYLVLRPYVPGAVQITLDDPGDPAPYWLVSSRRPEELASALSRAISVVSGSR